MGSLPERGPTCQALPPIMDAFTDLLDDGGFRTGFAVGLVGTLAVALGALVFRHTRPWAGLAFAAATAVAMADRYTFESELVIGLVVLAVGGLLTAGRHPVLGMVAAVPGAVVFVTAADLDRPDWMTDLDRGHPSWLPAAVMAVTAVGGALAADADGRLRATGLGPAMLAVSAFGVYFTTPDTEHAMVLVGVAVAVALAGVPLPLGSLGAAGATPAVAVLAWTVAIDGSFRPGSIVGGLACLGMFVVEPVVHHALAATGRGPTARPRGAHAADHGPDDRLAPLWRQPPARVGRALTVAALHVVLVAVCSRVAGLRESPAAALAIALPAHALAAAALAAVALRDQGLRTPQRTA
jgi:hypothetical protein